jgi:hypothetical protein
MTTIISCLYECFCGRHYPSLVDLEEHRRARGHFSSHRCRPSCLHPAPRVHDGRSHQCDTCGKICERRDILDDHQIATGHSYCVDCNHSFSTMSAFLTHRMKATHASEFICCDCDLRFRDVHALNAHMSSAAHRKPLSEKKMEKRKGPYCKDCRREFTTKERLEQHLRSLKHKPLSALVCPVGDGCRRKFPSPSALLLHLESGGCQSGMDRNEILRLVQLTDQEHAIHSLPILPPTELAGHSASPGPSPSLGSDISLMSGNGQSEWSLLSPAPSMGSVEDSSEQWSLLESSQLSLEGGVSLDSAVATALQCPLCPRKKKTFTTMIALQLHMESAAHSPKVYHCPTIFAGKKGSINKKFSTLSGLVQHLESGSCHGGKKMFRQCMELIQCKLEELGFGGMRLLLSTAKPQY